VASVVRLCVSIYTRSKCHWKWVWNTPKRVWNYTEKYHVSLTESMSQMCWYGPSIQCKSHMNPYWIHILYGVQRYWTESGLPSKEQMSHVIKQNWDILQFIISFFLTYLFRRNNDLGRKFGFHNPSDGSKMFCMKRTR
jgi:hypothetical protein